MAHSTTAEVLYVGNDMVVEVRNLAEEITGDSINDATVTCTLTDSAGANVTGMTWPLTLAYVAESDGTYRGTIEYDTAVVAGAMYTLTVSVSAGTGYRGQWQIPCVARART